MSAPPHTEEVSELCSVAAGVCEESHVFPKAANRGASHQTPTLPLQNLGTSEPKGPSPPLTTHPH